MAQATIQIEGAVGTVQLNPKAFSTGSQGFHGSGKVETQAGKYQLNVIAVLIGSKPKE